MQDILNKKVDRPITSAKEKRKKVKLAQTQIPTGTNLIFTPPRLELLYTNQEILALTSPLVNMQIPRTLGHVAKSHWVKDQVLELLGYQAPPGYRTEEAKMHKPKFIHQLLDIFAQSSSNLQVWNYVPSSMNKINFYGQVSDSITTLQPTFADARYLIVLHKPSGNIQKVILKSGVDLAKWDRTGTKTIKWQANITTTLRSRVAGKILVGNNGSITKKLGTSTAEIEQKKSHIQKSDHLDKPLIKEAPRSATLYTLPELATLVEDCINWQIEDPGPNRTRVIGQEFEKEIANRLGYKNFSQTDAGTYPDLVNQLVETKFQYRGTVDLGRVLPADLEPIKAPWNHWDISPADTRYIVATSSLENNVFTVQGLLVMSGRELAKHLSICEGTNFKVQMTIPPTELS